MKRSLGGAIGGSGGEWDKSEVGSHCHDCGSGLFEQVRQQCGVEPDRPEQIRRHDNFGIGEGGAGIK